MALLHPDEDKPHYSRSTTFMDGLNQAADAFTRRFQVTKPGMKRAHWAEDESQLKQKLVSFTSFAINNHSLTHEFIGVNYVKC